MILKVGGMSCGGCVNSVRKAITRAYPTASVEIELATGRVVVQTDDEPGLGVLERPRIVKAIEQAGFSVEEP